MSCSMHLTRVKAVSLESIAETDPMQIQLFAETTALLYCKRFSVYNSIIAYQESKNSISV